MAETGAPRRRARGGSFTARFALLLLAVGLATALAAGAVAWVETQQARSSDQERSAAGAADLELQLLRTQTALASQRFACAVAQLPSLPAAYRQAGSRLTALARSALSDAGAGQRLLLLSASGQVLAQVAAAGSSAAPLGDAAGLGQLAPASCAGGGRGGFFAALPGEQVVGLGAAPVVSGSSRLGRVVVLTPVTAAVLAYARRLAHVAGLGSSSALLVGSRLALPARIAGASYRRGAPPPAALLRVDGAPAAGALSLGAQQLVSDPRSLLGLHGETVASLLVLEQGAGAGLSLAQLALPLALAVAGVLLLGMVVVLILLELFLNRPLRRLDVAVQALGRDGYQTPVAIGAGPLELTRLAANFELVRKRLRHQLLVATGRSVIASTLTGHAPLEQALSQVLQRLVELLETDLAMILMPAHGQTAAGMVLLSSGSAEAPSWEEVAAGEGIISSLVEEPRFLSRNRLDRDDRGPLEERLGLRDCLATPLRSAEHDLGVLLVGNKRNPYREEDYTICRGVAEQIVVAVEKSTRLAVTEREATTDEMTGLYNYRFLVSYLDQQVNVAERAGSPLSVLMLDLDHFKEVNDTHGHPAGDRLLRQFASLMLETIRKSDLAARYGGEEFVVVMANTARADAVTVAEKIRAAVEAMVVGLEDGTKVRITVSIGGVAFPEGSQGARNLLDLADRALYAAKRNGRNRVEFVDVVGARGEAVPS